MKKDVVQTNRGLVKIINESTLKRMGKHLWRGFFIISACRGVRYDKDTGEPLDLSEAELEKINKQKTKELEEDIKTGFSGGLGFITTMGGYIEGGKYAVEEVSKVVPFRANGPSWDDFVKFAINLARRYEQDSVLVVKPEITSLVDYSEDDNIEELIKKVKFDAAYYEHDTESDDPVKPETWNYTKGDSMTSVVLDVVDSFYSRMLKGKDKGRNFKFEGVIYRDSIAGCRMLESKGELISIWPEDFNPKKAVDKILEGVPLKAALK